MGSKGMRNWLEAVMFTDASSLRAGAWRGGCGCVRCVGEVVEQAQLGYPAVAVGQGGDGADEEVVGLVVDHMVLGRDFGLVAFYGGFVGLAELDGGEGAAAADVVYGGVAGDGEEPGGLKLPMRW